MLKLNSSFNNKNFTVLYIKDTDVAKSAAKILLESTIEVFGLDIETSKLPGHYHKRCGLDPLLSVIRLVQLYDGERNVYIFDLLTVPIEILCGIFSTKRFIAHNAKFEISHLTYNGFPDMDISCSMLMSQMIYNAENSPLDPPEEVEDEDAPKTKRASHSLSAVTQRLFGKGISKTHQVSDWSQPELSTDQLLYAGLDAVLTYDIGVIFSKKIKEYRMEKAYKVIKDMQHVVAEMELTGFPVWWGGHTDLVDSWKIKHSQCVEKCKPFFGITNLRSSKQMGEWLQNYLKDNPGLLAAWPKTDKGAYTFIRTKIFPYKNIPAIAALLEYKHYDKLLNTFGDGFAEYMHPITRRVHSSFTLGETTTGRMSCRDPNLQQISRDGELRDVFRTNKCFVVADFGQIELRVQAALSKDPAMNKVFRENGDIYKAMASAFTGKNIDSITKEQRQMGKVLMLSLGYGMGPKKLRDYAAIGYDIHLSESEAERAHNTYYSTFSVYISWCNRVRQLAETLGYSRTVLGKIRKLLPEELYTKAPNHIVQGTSFEILGLACVKARNKLKDTDAKIVNIVHDEVIIECENTFLPEVSTIIKDAMIESMVQLFPEAPTEGLAEPHWGVTWKEAKG